MKYKIGDRVRIKSLEWYKKTLSIPSKLSWINKQDGFFEGIRCGSRVFTDAMCKFCGKIMTIQEVGLTFYLMEEDTIRYEFTDEMIECLVDEPQEKKIEHLADAEPQEKMVSLEKVEEWLHKNFYESYSLNNYGKYDLDEPYIASLFNTINEMYEDFHKTMEE